jgi:type I restriction enzyme S subunit
MNSWRTVEFQSLAADTKSAFTKPYGSAIMKADYVTSGVPVVRGVNLRDGIFLDDEFVFIPDHLADRMPGANLAPGDLVFTHRGTIGQVSMIPRHPRYTRYVLSTSQVKARLDQGRALPEFYYYWFTSPNGQHELRQNISTVGVPGLGQPVATIKALRVPYPSLPEQTAIAAVLSTLDDKISINERLGAAHEELLCAQFMELLIDTTPDYPKKIRVDDLIEFNPSLAIPRTDMAVYLDMASVPTTCATVLEWTRRPPKPGTRFGNGDTVMARITPCLENGKTAFIDFMEKGEIGIGSTEFIVMRARPGVPAQLPYFLARSPRFRTHAVNNMSGSSGRQRVSADQLVDFPLTKPDPELLAKFGRRASAAFSHIRSLTCETRSLILMRDTLLPRLMSGDIRVREAEKMAEDAT